MAADTYLSYGADNEMAHVAVQEFLREKMGEAATVDITGEDLETFRELFKIVGFHNPNRPVQSVFARREGGVILYFVTRGTGDGHAGVTKWSMRA